jgi:hypothetical protein
MATANEYLGIYILEYQSMLSKIENFGIKYPDNKEGYNALIEVAEDIQLRAAGAGFTSLPPLPKRK